MDKNKILRKLRKHNPTVMQEYYIEVDKYLENLKTSVIDDATAAKWVMQHIAEIMNKKNLRNNKNE